MQHEKIKNNSKNISTQYDDKSNHIVSMRNQIHKFMDKNNLSINQFVELSDIPLSTLNNLLYGNSTDCKLSTAILVAKALGISIDELTTANTIDEYVLENIIKCRNLPQNSLYLIKWFINHQYIIYNQPSVQKNKFISVMKPLYTNDGILKITNNFSQLDISELSDDLRLKIFLGIQLNCDFFMPMYSPFDILLIANDRKPYPREHVLVVVNDTLFIAKQRYENGHFNYYGIFDDKFRCNETGISEVIGYITGKISDPMSYNR